MPKYKVVVKNNDLIFFDKIECSVEDINKFKKDPNVLSVEEVFENEG